MTKSFDLSRIAAEPETAASGAAQTTCALGEVARDGRHLAIAQAFPAFCTPHLVARQGVCEGSARHSNGLRSAYLARPTPRLVDNEHNRLARWLRQLNGIVELDPVDSVAPAVT
eukprot:CAMPEP_0206317976 /NCGR_PEP_ID=MMETSP0106_2-20121207/16924_1 /ASSEMBLY_ACC=CAM_ASM_000206 /TAXON_ID=81532 /ORGANISM="Acanthoeca-like sp., Strain 10tr" /LENGTH=113 /DNA_ID=CAMNT_0053749607 /DNA_START=446 /DNA_END=788 /DNA_ORIENTATION=+